MKPTELLAPAGSPEALDAAVGEGANAVYLGLRSFNARMRSANFAFNQFEAAVEVCRRQSVKVYATVNTVFEDRESDRMWQLLQYLEQVGPDGIIVQDLGVAAMAKRYFPKLVLHASTQMNVSSARGVNFLSRFGFKRAVLSRELSLEEIRKLKTGTNLEIETFVHGALCVSASGLCLFSSYLGGRSANRGECTQACRRMYETDRTKGYFFSPDDLQLIEKIPDLVEAGVDSLKIEGRMKSAEYVGTVVAAYRSVLDGWQKDREGSVAKAKALLAGDLARAKTSFLINGPDSESYIHPEQPGGTGIPLGKVRDIRVDENGGRWALLNDFAGISEGDSVRIHRGDDSGRVTAKVRGVTHVVNGMLVLLDEYYRQSDQVYLVQTASMARRYKQVLPKDIARYHKFPSHERAPDPITPIPHSRKPLSPLKDGLYVLVGKVGDLHTTLTLRPTLTMLFFDRLNAEKIREEENSLPYRKDAIALWLDPYFPESDAGWLETELDYWIGKGVSTVVINNTGHFSLVRNKGLTVIAGPWLYSFNRWSLSFLLAEGVTHVIPPLEISKQDFQRVSEGLPPAVFMPVVFSFPPLFRIRRDLTKEFDSRLFLNKDGSGYELRGKRDYSTLIPSVPFSLVDKTPIFRKEGIGKFVLDFSSITLEKSLYRHVMKAALDGIVLQEAVRFNWKNGFWSADSKPGETGKQEQQ